MAWKKTHAIQLAAQLPEDLEEALEILRLTETLIRGEWGQSCLDEAPVRLVVGNSPNN